METTASNIMSFMLGQLQYQVSPSQHLSKLHNKSASVWLQRTTEKSNVLHDDGGGGDSFRMELVLPPLNQRRPRVADWISMDRDFGDKDIKVRLLKPH